MISMLKSEGFGGLSVERNDALGFIETYGLVSVLEAADAMCKAADVE